MRVVLVPNTRYEIAIAATRELAAWLAAEGFEPVLSSEDAKTCDLEGFAVSSAELGEPGLVVSLGGDGTILKAVHMIGETEMPLLGINMGRRGFLTGAAPTRIRESVSAALAGECRIERRSTIEAHVVMDGREVGRYRALNEVALGRGASGRVVHVDLDINGVRIASFACDGVVMATPTGSTAYALSAGGPIVSPAVDALLVVPVAPHTLQRRSIVLAPTDVIEVHLPDPGRRDACLSVDGDLTPCRRVIETVSVRRCLHDVLLVKLDGRDFYEVAREEFFGGR